MPRRLVYVVDRRAVVDQATTVADDIRERSQDSKLRVSTLRGQHVDNREWLADPASPAIIVGTVDMIGSRLLFSGYGVSRKMRPYHAGLLGADTLVVLDEAHLVPPFEKLLRTVEGEADTLGPHTEEDRKIVPRFRLLSLSATGRDDEADKAGKVFRLLPEDRKDKIVEERLSAHKRLTVEKLDDRKNLVAEIVKRAWTLGTEQGPARVIVYCDIRDDAVKVKNELHKKFKNANPEPVSELLVGGRRVFEREALSNWLKEYGFLGGDKGAQQPTFLIATSAGEVGVDLDADHMVCDLVAWERMVQRLGRVNRRGKGDARVEVIAAPCPKETPEDWKNRLICLRKLGDERHASPGAILKLKERAKNDVELQKAIEAAMTPSPLRPALTRALVDAWSMTSLDKHTGRPDDIQPWLRGWEENQPPETTIIWRKHLPVRVDDAESTKKEIKEIEAFFEAAPPHASEKLEIETSRAVDWLVKRAKQLFTSKNASLLGQEDVIAYVLSPARDHRHTFNGQNLTDSSDNKKKLSAMLPGVTLVVDARFGGLTKDGMLDEKADPTTTSEIITGFTWLTKDGMLDEKADGAPRVIDDGKEWLSPKDDEPVVRFRVRLVTAKDNTEHDGNWRERFRFGVERTEEGDTTRWIFVEKWRHDAETEDDRSVGRLQELAEHHAWTEGKARALAETIGLPVSHVDMLAAAARLHDEGKRHDLWQRAANAPPGKFYAKTDRRMNTRLLDGYRHEFGSLPYAQKDPRLGSLPDDLRDLALHLVAAHHGWARPIISTNGCDAPPSVLEKRACDVALRFARLQKQWGPWGLAWWEALLRAADQQASRDNDKRAAGTGENI